MPKNKGQTFFFCFSVTFLNFYVSFQLPVVFYVAVLCGAPNLAVHLCSSVHLHLFVIYLQEPEPGGLVLPDII